MDNRVHISLEVSDIANAVAFYSKLFQQQPTKLRDDYANFRMESPSLHLSLVHQPGRSPEAHSNRHYGIELFSDERLEGWLDVAKKDGLQPRIEENITCCYATANKFWTKDPDGHEWEFWVRHGEAEVMHEAPKAVKPKACCAPGQC